MAIRRVLREKRKYLKYNSDRSGFTYFKRELVNDNGWWVHPEERDEPTPFKRSVGGVNKGEMRSNRKAVPEDVSGIWEEFT